MLQVHQVTAKKTPVGLRRSPNRIDENVRCYTHVTHRGIVTNASDAMRKRRYHTPSSVNDLT